ncbi:MAG: GntR family transcriptional regulator [Limnohabitans sp.]|jgi:DNA-binding GntR family transcriptional regulator|nr:GntR family transcriptional regulator [Limnohabitans sp.]
MKTISLQPNLVDQVKDALLEEITSGKLSPGERIIQEQIALALGVSRQPVQQALLLLRNQGVLKDAGGRGLIVAPLDADHVAHIYEMRAVIEGLACRLAATHRAEQARKQGSLIIEAGRKAVASGSIPKMIAADIKFHELLYSLSGNPLIGPAMATHLTYTQRVMGEVLIEDQEPRDIWDQHEKILEAIAKGKADLAEKCAKEHLTHASQYMVSRLKSS